MIGDRFDLCVDSCAYMCRSLPDVHRRVRFSLFSDRPVLVYDGDTGEQASKAVRDAAIAYSCSGQTSYYDTLATAVRAARTVIQSKEVDVCTVVMATDGVDTCSSLFDESSCKVEVEKAQSAGEHHICRCI